jgi:hypothetical protein
MAKFPNITRTIINPSGVVEGRLRGAEPPLLKFHVNLGGGGAEPPYIFCTLHNLNNVKNTYKNISKRECSLELHFIFSHHLTQ